MKEDMRDETAGKKSGAAGVAKVIFTGDASKNGQGNI